MVKVKIITNNPLVDIKYFQTAEFLDSGADGVLLRARDYIHLGARLLSHPLSGCVLLGVSPYKSLVILEAEKNLPAAVDIMSLGLIENAIKLMKRTPVDFKGNDEKILEDFRVIDLDLLDSAMISIPV